MCLYPLLNLDPVSPDLKVDSIVVAIYRSKLVVVALILALDERFIGHSTLDKAACGKV
jgi:hypothetical protein